VILKYCPPDISVRHFVHQGGAKVVSFVEVILKFLSKNAVYFVHVAHLSRLPKSTTGFGEGNICEVLNC